MNIHKFDIITYEEKWPTNKPKNMVSRTHELTLKSNNKNKWIDHLITISSNENDNNERWVDIDFVNGVFYFNKNKQYLGVQYVGKYDYNSDEIHWYRNMQDRKNDINMIFKWVQQKKIVLIPKPRLVPQHPPQKLLKNNSKPPDFDGTSIDDFPTLNILNKPNVELIDVPPSLNIHSKQLLSEPTLDDIPIPFGLDVFDMDFNNITPPPGLEHVFNNDINNHATPPGLEHVFNNDINNHATPPGLEHVFNNDINNHAPPPGLEHVIHISPPPLHLPPPPPSYSSINNNTFNYIPKNSVWH
jgi:hypothetical protein